MEKTDLKLKIYGVRGSYPPTNGDITRFGVNTTSLRLDVGKHLIIIDAGTGIINLGADLISEMQAGKTSQNISKAHLFFTHTHLDHLMGFPYFSLLYIPGSELHIIAPTMLNNPIRDVIEKWMSPEFFPVTIPELGCNIKYYDFDENRSIYFFDNDFQIIPAKEAAKGKNWVVQISCLRNFTHPRSGSYIYKFKNPKGKTIVLATDIEGFVGGDQRLINFARGADLLIHDAQYNLREYQMFQGFGHSTYQMACEVAKKAEVEKLLLFHHDPKHSDQELSDLESKAREIFPESYMATESMEFIFS